MNRRKLMQGQWLLWAASAAIFSLSLMLGGNAYSLSPSEDDHELKLLGKFVFFDKISAPARQSCSSCHEPTTGGTNNNSIVNNTVVAVPGANFHVSGGLKPPTNAYASFIENFQPCTRGGAFFDGPPGGSNTKLFCGGNFWDGRAEGRNFDPLFPPPSGNATKHIGDEVFQGAATGDANDFILAYSAYFGPTSDQALNPMPNPVEQNIQRQAVCEHVASASYAVLYEMAWGEPIDCSSNAVPYSAPDADIQPEREFDISFKRLMLAVGAWQHSAELNSFSSKRDKALRAELACADRSNPELAAYYDPSVCAHPNYINSPGKFPLVGFTAQENLGHDLFYNTRPPGPPRPPPFPNLPVTQCAFCHLSDTSAPDGTGLFERYTDDAYHNIGTPANPAVPADPQKGIGGHVLRDPPQNQGFFKTPTLRNVDKRTTPRFIKAYTHNGWFKSLESLVHFYNTAALGSTAATFGITRCPDAITAESRALRAKCWPEPEWPGAVFGLLVGNQGMTAAQEAALVAYLKTFTDSVTPQPPPLSELDALVKARGIK